MKEVLKEADYKKIFSIAEAIDDQRSVIPAEAKKLCGKSETTTWRYLNILMDTGYVVSEGNTDSIVYKGSTEKNGKVKLSAGKRKLSSKK